jgi:signal transduction histidine kinase
VVQLNTTLIDNLEQINLHDVIEMNIRNVQLFAVEKNVTIHNVVAKEVTVKGISAYISSVIINFITNAIKYSNPEADSFLKLSTLMTDDYVELTIEDNGIGIDLQKNGTKLFGMYKTFHSNTDARGIGLFITKNQVEAMGGKIEVESVLHEGTTFRIKLKK